MWRPHAEQRPCPMPGKRSSNQAGKYAARAFLIPALDGGHLAFYAAEAVRRKPASPRSQEWAFRTGIAFVLALMLFVTINDVVSLLPFGG